MKLRLLTILGIVLISASAFAQNSSFGETLQAENDQNGAALDAVEPIPALFSELSAAEQGNWFWALIDNQTLLSGASAVATDPNDPETIYVGGSDYLSVSHDGGLTWTNTPILLQKNDETDADESSSMNDEQKAEFLREYLRTNLEEQFDQSYVDNILDDITDEDLLEAQDVTDLTPLQDMELDMDSDLRSAPYEAQGGGRQSIVSDWDSFIVRYRTLLRAGATENVAASRAANNGVIWQIIPTPSAVFAISSHYVFVSTDRGASYQTVFTGTTFSILSAAVSQTGDVLIGTTDGLYLSDDHGRSFHEIAPNIEEPVFKIYATAGVWYALTPDAFYTSVDQGLTWDEDPFSGLLTADNYLVDLQPGNGHSRLVLTNQALSLSFDGSTYNQVPTDAFEDRDILGISADRSLQNIIVQTNDQIYEFNGTNWVVQNKGLETQKTGTVTRVLSDNAFAVMTTSSGVWLAYSAASIENNPIYQKMLSVWAQEPSDDSVVEAALAAHYLDDRFDSRWRLRSRLAWILPRFTFEYKYEQMRADKDTHTQDGLTYALTRKFEQRRETISEYAVMAFWNLRIEQSFHDDQTILSLEAKRSEARQKLIQNVVEALNVRRALQTSRVLAEMSGDKQSVLDAVNYELDLMEIETRLQYLTGGFFLNAIKEAKVSSVSR